MNAILLPDIDRSTLEDLRRRIPNLDVIDLSSVPSTDDIRKGANRAIDRMLGRPRASVWPWVAAGLGIIALVGAVAGYLALTRRWSWTGSTPWAPETASAEDPVEGRASGSPATGPSDTAMSEPVEDAGAAGAP